VDFELLKQINEDSDIDKAITEILQERFSDMEMLAVDAIAELHKVLARLEIELEEHQVDRGKIVNAVFEGKKALSSLERRLGK